MFPPDVCVQDCLECRSVISSYLSQSARAATLASMGFYLLFDVKNGDVCGNGNFSPTQRPQQGRLSNTILTHQTIPPPICKCQGRISENPLSSDRYVDTINLDVLALWLGVGT